MPISSKQKRELAARAQRLPVRVSMREGGATEGILAHLHGLLAREGLVKVRVQTRDREACDAAVAALAERLGCELIARIGRVAIFYRAPAELVATRHLDSEPRERPGHRPDGAADALDAF